MAKILIIGCGDLGSTIARQLCQSHQVIGVRRSKSPSSANIQTIQADVSLPASLKPLINLNANIVIYCVSADAQTDESYRASYVTGLKNVLTTQINNQHLQHVFFVSSTRLYGQATQDLLDENTPAMPVDFGGERLLEAEKLLKTLNCNATAMRLSGIYGTGRLYLVNMAKEVSHWPVDNHWSNRIHRDDAAGFIAFMVQKVLQKQAIEDCYIVTDDMPTLQYTVLVWLAIKLGVETSHVKLPTTQPGKRLSNVRLRATGYQLQYPNYQIGYGKIIESLDNV